MYRTLRTAARPPAIMRRPRKVPLSRLIGATPTRAAISSAVEALPVPAAWASRVRAVVEPIPGTLFSRSSSLLARPGCRGPPGRGRFRCRRVPSAARRGGRRDVSPGAGRGLAGGGCSAPIISMICWRRVTSSASRRAAWSGTAFGLRADALGEQGDGRGIEAVGLGEPAGGPREIADLPGIDDHQRQAGAGQRRRHGDLEAAGRFQHDQRRPERGEPGDEACPGLRRRAQRRRPPPSAADARPGDPSQHRCRRTWED